MKIYLDYVFFLNYMFDFLLLLSVSIILRRNIKLKRVFLGSLIGSMTIFILFIKMNSLELFLIKLVTSILMVIVTFGCINIKYVIKNLIYLYISSILLGGFLYFLNIQFSYNQEGLVFYNDGLSINVIVLLLTSPIIIYTYVKQLISLKTTYSNNYKVDIKYKNEVIKLNAFLDTGNKLKDPITNKSIIIVKDKYFKEVDKYSLIPYSTISESKMIKCIKPDEVKINNKVIKNTKIGLVKKLKMEGIECILSQEVVEQIS